MKKIFLALIFIAAGVVVSIFALAGLAGSARETRSIKPQPVEEGVDRYNASAANDYLYSCFPRDENGRPVFPDTFGGHYFPGEGNDKLAILLTVSDPSEYLFIQEEFPCVVFEQVRYSYNYLDELLHEYLTTFDRESETVYGGEFDLRNNRAVILVDEETLSRKTNDPDSPIEFRLGSPYDSFLDYDGISDDSSFVPYGINTPIEK